MKILSNDFSDDVCIKLMVKSENVTKLVEKITDETYGMAKIEVSDEYYGDFA